MPKIEYVHKRFGKDARNIVSQANTIIDEYSKQGFDLTLRQLYYQFVSRDSIANSQRDYKRLGQIVNDARLAGLIDWDAITDRTRNLASNSHWLSPADIIKSAARGYRIDRWHNQRTRPEVWIEKEALAGVFDGVCTELDIPYFCCRGYTSQSEMWAAGQRFKKYLVYGRNVTIFHFGDHDPSGIDMTRDIEDRLKLFIGDNVGGCKFNVERLALNMDQIEQYNPPPNPAKMTDARAEEYVRIYGTESWELDALDPNTLVGLVRRAFDGIVDEEMWKTDEEIEEAGRNKLEAVSINWDKLTKKL